MTKRAHFDEALAEAAFAGVDDVVPAGPRLALTDWTSVRIEPVHWLMLNRLPFAELTIVEGDGGLGKTTAVLDIAARVSTGTEMPDGTPVGEPGDVVLIAEEDRASILKARLRAGGANLSRIHHVSAVGDEGARFSLPSHGQALLELVADVSARLVIIDAIFNHIDPGLKIIAAEDVRRMLSPLTELAHVTGVSVIGIRHWGKTARSATSRGLGSIDITNCSRSVLAVGRHPSDDQVRVIAVAKSNLGEDVTRIRSLTFTIESTTIADEVDPTVSVSIGRVAWGEEAEISADDLSTADPENGHERTKVAAAAERMRELLTDGEHPAQEVQKTLRAEGVARATIFRAKRKAGVITSPSDGFPRTVMWSLPSPRPRDHAKDDTTDTTGTADTADTTDSGALQSQKSLFLHDGARETTDADPGPTSNGPAAIVADRDDPLAYGQSRIKADPFSQGGRLCRKCGRLGRVRGSDSWCTSCVAADCADREHRAG